MLKAWVKDGSWSDYRVNVRLRSTGKWRDQKSHRKHGHTQVCKSSNFKQ